MVARPEALRLVDRPLMAWKSQRIVFKFGSGVLTNERELALDEARFHDIAAGVAALIEAGNECVLVSSAAVAAGLKSMGLSERPAELAARQACAAVGQSKLMRQYEASFARHQLDVAQLLLTHSDLDSRTRYHNAQSTLAHLFKARRIVPIINENDSVAVEELRFGDNDRLSAEVAIMAGADLLVLLTSVDGLLDEQGALISVVDDIETVAGFAREEKGRYSVGGMVSKLQAVKLAVEARIPTIIANGARAAQIPGLVDGTEPCTRFHVARRDRTLLVS
jgi:glutamate 5-kinase